MVARIFVCTPTCLSKREYRRVHFMIGCAGFASRALEIRTATMVSAENVIDVISRRVRPSRRGQRIESRQPSRRRSRPKWQRWRKSWNDTDKRRKSLNPHCKRQTCRQGQRTKWRSSTLDSCRQLECSRLNRAFWPLSRAWNSTEPRSWRSRSRCKNDGITCSSFTDKLQLKLRTDPRPLTCKSWSQMESTSTCSRRQRTASRKLQISMRRNAKQRQQQRTRPHVRRRKRWSWTSLETSMTGRTQRLTPLPRHESTKSCRLKPEATQRGWQSCGRRWPGILARQFLRRGRSKGSASRRRASEISIVTINGNFWTTHAEWMRRWGHDIWCWDRNVGSRRAGVRRKPQSSNVGGYVCRSAQALAAGMGLASGAGRAKSFVIRGGSRWHGFLSWEDSQSSVSTSTTQRSGRSETSRTGGDQPGDTEMPRTAEFGG